MDPFSFLDGTINAEIVTLFIFVKRSGTIISFQNSLHAVDDLGPN